MTALAHHEAGHAVVAAALGVSFHSVSIRGAGFLRFHEHPSTWDVVLHRRAAAVALAGSWAETFYLNRGVGWSRSDRALAEEYIDRSGERLADLSLGARRIVEAYWPAVRRVAAELIAVGEMNSLEVERCMRKR